MHPPELAVLYSRVSTDHQENSIAMQEAVNPEYCLRFHLTALDPYTDEDVSGSIPFLDRCGGRALMHRLQLGDVKHLVTAKQERLGRDTFDQIKTIRAIWGLGITPHFTCEGGALPRTPSNELLFEIKASVAQYDRNQIAERTRLVLRHKRAAGQLTGSVPYGWDVEYTFANGSSRISARALSAEELAAWGKVTSKLLVAHPDEQAVLRMIAAWRATGHTLKTIAASLNAQGHRTKLGGEWRTSTVESVLNNQHTKALLAQASAPGDEQQAA